MLAKQRERHARAGKKHKTKIYDSDPKKNRQGEAVCGDLPSRRPAKAAPSDGFHGVLAVHGQQDAHHRFRLFQAAQSPSRGLGRESGRAGQLIFFRQQRKLNISQGEPIIGGRCHVGRATAYRLLVQ